MRMLPIASGRVATRRFRVLLARLCGGVPDAVRPAQEYREHPRPARLVVSTALQQDHRRRIGAPVAARAEDTAVASAVRRRPSIDQVARVVDHVDDAIAVAIVGFLPGTDPEEQSRPPTGRVAIHQCVRDPRRLHRLRIRILRGEPERRRERAHAPEQLRILPTDAERTERPKRPAQEGPAIGVRARAIARVDGQVVLKLL
jgi:hypothetical protein